MDSMGHKHPISILIDGNEAIRQAIDEIFPNSQHMICGWHVSKNASTHLQKEEKKSPYRYLLYKQISEDEFEELWKELLEQHGLKENNWMSKMYDMKHRHAHNSTMRGYEQLHEGLCLRQYEFPNKKRKVVYHLDRVGIQEVDENGVWDSKKYNQPLISCDCNLFKGKGIPYRHMFYVMKVEHLRKIPEFMIFKRWIKSVARDVLMKPQLDDKFFKGIDISRFALLSVECNYLYHNGSQTE
ncbi:hypothetical protein Ddye_017102 [Dipteronia dyeriana]|uniref:MULE transposase domain-containing protein n=1 Tax=Dipteronia dyeriana TaxID=168575 RepID=A0AAD9U8P3_9ROSI|nr:hypothetical protein Ddye_017102 [Dipteronia dyeriana]